MPTINGKACVANGTPVDKVFSDGRQVYGRNYIKNSNQTIAINGDTDHYKILYYNLTQGVWTFSANAEYTRGTDTAVNVQVRNAGHAMMLKEISAPIINGKISATFDVPDDGKELLVYASSGAYWTTTGKTLEVSQHKLEKGTTATPWTPAPEDVM